jgi:hypothetical protein
MNHAPEQGMELHRDEVNVQCINSYVCWRGRFFIRQAAHITIGFRNNHQQLSRKIGVNTNG